MIALKLRRIGAKREFLHLQIFAGLSYLAATLVIIELLRYRRHAARQRNNDNALSDNLDSSLSAREPGRE